MYGRTEPQTDQLRNTQSDSSGKPSKTLLEPPTTLPKAGLRRPLLPDFQQTLLSAPMPQLEPLPSLSPIPQSYLLAMRALQTDLQKALSEVSQSRLIITSLTEQNAALKQQLLDSERDKLQSQTKVNSVLKDYNTLGQILEQTRFDGMLMKREIEQLKKEKQNVLEKVTEKMCKERAIDRIVEREERRNSLATVKENINIANSNFRTPYLKQAISTQIPPPTTPPPMSSKPLFTLNPNCDSPILAAHSPTPSISLLSNRYSPLESSSSYVQLVKGLMKKQKLLVEMTHQLECYQKQLLAKKDGKEKTLAKIEVLRGDIMKVRKEIAEDRRRQSLL